MIFRAPSYYERFTCIAGACTDSCCIGWEIDIDRETADSYKQIDGAFGQRLRSCIHFGETAYFQIDEQERCPFLNANNLCDIILQLGESSLCQICSDHPRFYEWFGNIKEGGLGLCCEEAARIILTDNTPFTVVETEIPDEECEPFDAAFCTCLRTVRKELFDILQNEEISLGERIGRMLELAENRQECLDNGISAFPQQFAEIPADVPDMPEILEFLQTLEVIGKNWRPTLASANKRLGEITESKERFAKENPQASAYLRNIAVYFIWRYFLKGTFDGEFLSRVKLAAVSVAVIGCLFADHWLEYGTLSPENCAQIAKNYSKEIEYSEENLNAMLDAAYELSGMSTAKLKGIFR